MYLEADYDIAEKVFVAGDFAESKWRNHIQMKYSFFNRAFKAKIKIQDGNQFKFIIDGMYIWWAKYPMTYTQERYTNNVFKIYKNKNHNNWVKAYNEDTINYRWYLTKDENSLLRSSHTNGSKVNRSFRDSLLYNQLHDKKLSKFSPDVNLSHRL